MSNAPYYNPVVSFANEETNTAAGRSTVRTVAVDTEFANASSSINALNNNLQLMQRDDGKPKDFLIEPYALSEQSRALISSRGNPRGIWVAATQYAIGDATTNAGIAYLAVIGHTSTSTFDPSLWMAISGDGSAAASAVASSTSAAAALASEASATASALTATTKASAAAASALAALNSETTTTNSALAAAANKAATDSNVTATNNSAISAAASAAASSGSAADALASKNSATASQSSASTSASTATTQAGISTAQAVIATAKAVLTAADVVTTAASQAAALASKNSAGVSEVNALASANAAALSYDSFDDRYLGTKSADPSLDNDGNTLLTGALYFNITSNVMRVYNGATWQATNLTAISDAIYFRKPLPQAHCFTKTGAGTIAILAGTDVAVAGLLVSFSVQTAITMPTLTAGTDYAIYACTDGTIRADASFSFPTGYTALNSRKIGGFHYAPGGNAAARAGGDTTPAINEYSIWDLKFKPASPDPRGLSLVSGNFWQDIYPLGVDHIVNGTSKYNVTIADGSSPPKVPTQFGGNGTATYTTLTWWEAAEVMAAYGKRLPSYAEFAAGAFGTTEATSGGTDPISTILRAAFTSKWGTMLATGNMWFWGAEFGGGAAGAAWTANTNGRGSTYQMENAAIFGGSWVGTSYSGSRASGWDNSPTYSVNSIGARGVCDHVVLE